MKAFVFLCVVAAAWAIREPVEKSCTEKPDKGMCLGYFPSYYYDPETGTCKPFIYGGCQGNGNRYYTEEECLENCAGVTQTQKAPDVCSLERDSGPCYGYFRKYYYDRETGECQKFIYGGCRGNGNRFSTPEECQATCISAPQAALDRPDCDKEPDAGLCEAYMPRYYYDQETGECKMFVYGGCGGNKNNFRTKDECYNKCGALRTQSVCEQEKEVGPCKGAFPRYYYNKETGQCEHFIYGGCAGNDNNFQRKEVCEAFCVVSSAARAPSKCSLKPETGRCKGNFPRYYYVPETKTCQVFTYGGCGGNENNFITEEECLEECSDPEAAPERPDCDKAPDAGLCDAYMPRYYYDQETGECKMFVYGGCGGNKNNFRTKDECYNKCGETEV